MRERAIFCYKGMPFGLKNEGATYKNLIDRVFVDLVRKIMVVYVDDIVVKSTLAANHPTHKVHYYNMRLNLEKCSFDVGGDKFMGFMINQRGIKTNPNKCEAILSMTSLTNL